MRDDNYLQGRLDYLWDRYFADVGQNNDVRIQFGRRARTRLGSIKQLTINNKQLTAKIPNSKAQITNKFKNLNVRNSKLKDRRNKDKDWIPAVAGMTGRVLNRSHQTSNPIKPTIITINGLFKEAEIPEFLIDSVIAHEMVHYAHGFASPHEKKYDSPHAGGVILKEMQERGIEDLYLLQKKWLKENWREFTDKHLPRKAIHRIRRRKRRITFLLR